jgi:hypothetical protein
MVSTPSRQSINRYCSLLIARGHCTFPADHGLLAVLLAPQFTTCTMHCSACWLWPSYIQRTCRSTRRGCQPVGVVAWPRS